MSFIAPKILRSKAFVITPQPPFLNSQSGCGSGDLLIGATVEVGECELKSVGLPPSEICDIVKYPDSLIYKMIYSY